MIAFVSGGARSGKSAYGERLACAWQRQRGGMRYYLATASVGGSDTEMAARIARHRRERGAGWSTLEVPVALDRALADVTPESTVLLDCLTLWASQVLYASELDEAAALEVLTGALATARARRLALVVVSNDVNEGLPPEDSETRRYIAFLQAAHRQVAAQADTVVQVIAGLPQLWKGRLL